MSLDRKEPKKEPPSPRFWLVMFMWVLFAVYVYSLPWLARKVNHNFWMNPNNRGNEGPLCTISVELPGLKCHNGLDVKALAAEDGREVICGCTQGMFGEALCPLYGQGFTLSQFLGSTTAHATMVSFSMGPVLSTWWYLGWVVLELKPNAFLMRLMFACLCVFQTFWGLWLLMPFCLFVNINVFDQRVCGGALVMFWGVTAFLCWKEGRKGAAFVIMTVGVCCICCLLLIILSGYADCRDSFWMCTYGPWFFESSMLVMGFGLTPFVMWTDNIRSTRTAASRPEDQMSALLE